MHLPLKGGGRRAKRGGWGSREFSHFNRTAIKTARARTLRRDGTDVERRLWQKLRNAQIDGASFRRQHPAGRYILDFYCPALQLAIELDGDSMRKQRSETVFGMDGLSSTA